MKQLFLLAFSMYIPIILGMELTTPPNSPNIPRLKRVGHSRKPSNVSHVLNAEYEKAKSILELLLAEAELNEVIRYHLSSKTKNAWGNITEQLKQSLLVHKIKHFFQQEPDPLDDEYAYFLQYFAEVFDALPCALSEGRKALLDLLNEKKSVIESMGNDRWERTWLTNLHLYVEDIVDNPPLSPEPVIEDLTNLVETYRALVEMSQA